MVTRSLLEGGLEDPYPYSKAMNDGNGKKEGTSYQKPPLSTTQAGDDMRQPRETGKNKKDRNNPAKWITIVHDTPP